MVKDPVITAGPVNGNAGPPPPPFNAKEAVNAKFAYEEVPEIVDMSLKVPRQYKWCRTTNLREEVVITATLNSIRVASSGVILDEREFSQHGSNARFYVESRLKDWETVLKNVKADFKTNVYSSINWGRVRLCTEVTS